MNILLVEDEVEWRGGLEDMYRIALGRKKGRIDLAATAAEALTKLSENRYDIMSLDINLGKTIEMNEDRVRPNASGMDVLYEAKRSKHVKAVIVISGCPYDQDLVTVIPDDDERIEVQMQMIQILERMFPKHSATFFKSSLYDVESHISRWCRSINDVFLKELVEGELMAPPYILKLEKLDGEQVRVSSATKGARIKSVSFRKHPAASFLFALALGDLHGNVVTQEFLAKLFDEGREIGNLAEKSALERERDDGKIDANDFHKKVSTYFVSIREFLRTRRIDPRHLITVMKGKGYKLAPDVVKIHGRDLDIQVAGWGGDVRDPMENNEAKSSPAESVFCDEREKRVSVETCDDCVDKQTCSQWA